VSIVSARRVRMPALWRLNVVLLATALGVLSLAAAPALAHRNHVFAKAFGGVGAGAGDMKLVAPVKEFEANGGDITGGSEVAVDDATHDVYVADTGNLRVDEFSASGVFILAFGHEVDATTKGDVCTAASGNVCQAGVAGSQPGEFETPTFIAVDNSAGGEGDVYVGDTGDDLVSKFTSEGALIATWGDNGTGEAPNGQLAGPPTERFTHLSGIAVGASGNLWIEAHVEGQEYTEVLRFARAGAYGGMRWQGQFEPSGIAVNNSEELYIADGSPDVEKRTETGASPGASLFGEPFEPSENVTGLAVDPVGQEVFLDREAQIVVVSGSCPPPDSGCVVAESFGGQVLRGGAGVAVDPDGAVYAAETSGDVVDLFEEEPAGSPSVVSDSVSEVTGTGALLGGEVKLRSLSDEGETKYYFEYGVCPSANACGSTYEAQTPAGELPASFEEEAVDAAPIEGLRPGVTYHYRLVAENEFSEHAKTPAFGEERAFTTQSAGGFELPDDRLWEMVSPVQKHGALIEPIGQEGVIQASVNGNAITYHANAPIELGAQGATNQVQVLSTRGPGGWSSHDIELPHGTTGKPENEGEAYRFFSEDLSLALVQPMGAFEPALSAEASEVSPMLRSDYLNGNVAELCLPTAGMHCYRPLVTGKEGYANVPPGTHFGEAEVGGSFAPCPQSAVFCGPNMDGASENDEHVVFSSYAQLTETQAPSGSLYEWNAGKLAVVDELPEHSGIAPGLLGGGIIKRHAISPDGSRVVWTDQATGAIYLRLVNTSDPNASSTVLIGGGEFQTANREVTKIFFTSGGDLFEYDLGAAEPLIRLTNGAAILPAAIIGASEDGSYAYFVANGALDSAGEGAVQGNCNRVGTGPWPGQLCNLYVYHDGSTKLIAVLSAEDGPDWADESPGLQDLTARVSPDGRFLAFMSARDLTGYDTRDARTGAPDEEVYLYDSETGRLACASCEPSGARPHGVEYGLAGENVPLLADGYEVWSRFARLAASVPGWTAYDSRNLYAAYQSRYLSDSGRLFFNSDDGLVPRDGNGTWDVYEYEPEGMGPEGARCGPAAASGSDVFKPAHSAVVEGRGVEEGAGCVALISSGSSSEESAFLDASGDGGDVFFLTAAKLAPQDGDNAFDVYDAHECSAVSPCSPVSAAQPQACETESSCKAAPTPQPAIFGAPASATFFGEGDLLVSPPAVAPPSKPLTRAQKLARALKSCRKDRRRSKRVACEKQARHRYAATKSSRTNNHRRAGS
jgi:DNA-binding beta-propeller fold protein YncE